MPTVVAEPGRGGEGDQDLVAGRLGPEQVRRHLAEISKLADREAAGQRLVLLARRWAAQDPVAPIEFSGQDGLDQDLREVMLEAGFFELARIDPQGARELAFSLQGGDRQFWSVLIPLFEGLAVSQPELGLSWLGDREIPDREPLVLAFFGRWARVDGRAAASGAARCQSEAALEHAVRIWAQQDPLATADWAGASGRHAVLQAVVEEADFAARRAISDRVVQVGALQEELVPLIGEAFFELSYESGMAWLGGIRDRDLRAQAEAVAAWQVGRWHPDRVASFLGSVPDGVGAERGELLEQLACATCFEGADRARAWVFGLGLADREVAWKIVVPRFPELLVEWPVDGVDASAYWTGAARTYRDRGEVAARSWVAALEGRGEQRLAAVAGFANAWAETSPAEAIGYASVEIGEGDHPVGALGADILDRIVRGWVSREPVAAIAWLEQNDHPRSAGVGRATEIDSLLHLGEIDLARRRFDDGMQAVVEGRVTAGAALVESGRELVKQMVRRDAVGASDWLRSIDRPVIRRFLSQAMACEWNRFEPGAALAWVEAVGEVEVEAIVGGRDELEWESFTVADPDRRGASE